MKRRYTRKQLKALRDAGALDGKLPNAALASDANKQSPIVNIQLPIRLKINRNLDGLIDSVDVIQIAPQNQ